MGFQHLWMELRCLAPNPTRALVTHGDGTVALATSGVIMLHEDSQRE